ncbi:hypothetical protein VNO78_30618 [Psophocarpus tetragonolobus]|uniref:Peptidase S8/S53 domain-containing protein n=1 Tax=Psophocarpus tetragonolobus TaxID=3891 RepID=A0AAN9X5P8_PSOTE
MVVVNSEAAGRFVENGSVVGMASNVNVAMYKVCNDKVGCTESAILAAMDTAFDDGVDVLSLTLGSASLPFSQDPIAIGALLRCKIWLFLQHFIQRSPLDSQRWRKHH